MFASIDEYLSRLGDVEFWWPHVASVLERTGLRSASLSPRAGEGGTFPTFIYGDHVVKLFGGWPSWAQSYAAERAAYRVLSTSGVRAPRFVAEGQLFESASEWPFLITTRMPGVPWHETSLTAEQQLALVSDLGAQVRELHHLRPIGISSHDDAPMLDVVEAARRSSLPERFVSQVRDFVMQVPALDRVLVHGDFTPSHVFVENGTFSGIIDWGDALSTDRHYELAKLHLNLFAGAGALLRAFLAASEWPMADDFPRRALAFALYRQAHGLVQHHSMDVFHRMSEHLALDDIDTLDELARALFAI